MTHVYYERFFDLSVLSQLYGGGMMSYARSAVEVQVRVELATYYGRSKSTEQFYYGYKICCVRVSTAISITHPV